jgi:hypothetical protein
MASFQSPPDEGYSEDPLGVQLSGTSVIRPGFETVPAWVLNMTVEDRARKCSYLPHEDVYLLNHRPRHEHLARSADLQSL